jgi:hypothetical protein
VRLRDRSLTGTIEMQVRSGPVAFAKGRGRIVRGVARMRMRTRLPLVSGRYSMIVVVRAKGRHRPITRTLGVNVLGGAPA